MNKILIIEDDISMLNMYQKLFNYEGFTTIISEDGEKGVKAAVEQNPDVVLLDIMMPKKSGFQVLEDLKKDEKTKNIPVILLTNLSSESVITEAFSLGAVGYLVKSQTPNDQIVAEVKKYIKP
jgi:DNA-binding response OmpR family regulator